MKIQQNWQIQLNKNLLSTLSALNKYLEMTSNLVPV